MNIDLMRRVDYLAGIPLCFVATLLVRTASLLAGQSNSPPKNVLFIELSEMGSTILADPAMRKMRRVANAELHFLIFRPNAGDVLPQRRWMPERFVAVMRGLHQIAALMLTDDSGPRHFSAVTEMMFDNYRSDRQAAAAFRKS